VKQQADVFLTTHTGSLPRPPALSDLDDAGQVKAAVGQLVRQQVEAGIDIVNDGEASKPSYATYVAERLSGFGGERPSRHRSRDLDEFPEFFASLPPSAVTTTPFCQGPVAYRGTERVEADIDNLRSAAGGRPAFMSAASPGVIALWLPNEFYASTEEYVFALADAMKPEYDAIVAAGLILQVDCPDLPMSDSSLDDASDAELAAFREHVATRLAAVDHATRDIPPERMRIHLCWGNGEGPHHTDVPLARFIDLVLAARPAAVSFEGANPRHEHEWALWEDVKLPDGKLIIPGVLDSTTNFIEHPELVAQRLVRYADAVGKANVIAGTDCGFATIAGMHTVDPRITWAKLAAMAEGARLASGRLR
jgi:5-methyltetrahydropteroyltriglutamate--homocysteine methyltransferase